MRLAILSGGGGWHVRDVARAAAADGHESAVIDLRTVSAGVASAWRPLPGFDAVLVRSVPAGSLEQVVFRMDVLHRLRAVGVPVLNPPAALEACVDKYLACARLEAAGLPVPATVVAQDAESALRAFEQLGGDVVVKPLFGSEGKGMTRVSDPEVAWRVFHALARCGSVLYLQQFVRHPGWDLRVLVLGGRVLGAMRRRSTGWRTNVAQGGEAEPVELAGAERELARRAAAAVAAPLAGVDLLPGGASDWYVPEVNAAPGWRALAGVTGVDVAAAVVRFLASWDGK